MRLARVRCASGTLPAVEIDGHWVATQALEPRRLAVSDVLAEFDALAPHAVDTDLERLVAAGHAVACQGAALAVPLDRTRKVLAIGLNYLDHIREVGATRPAQPVLFGKFPSALHGPYDDVVLDPRLTRKADYEVELAVVIGRGGRDLTPEDALGAVAGYAVANDVSSRDLQRAEPQWLRSKSFDGFCPLGPWITTADAVPDPGALALSSAVNGEVRQQSSTAAMLFDVPWLLAFLSTGITLEAGDVVLTGTPPGVAEGMAGQPWLQPGDVVRCQVEGLGHLENRFVAAA